MYSLIWGPSVKQRAVGTGRCGHGTLSVSFVRLYYVPRAAAAGGPTTIRRKTRENQLQLRAFVGVCCFGHTYSVRTTRFAVCMYGVCMRSFDFPQHNTAPFF